VKEIIIHTLPVGDLREHVESEDCWCGPEVIEEDLGKNIVHHALDEREKFETGERKPS